MSFLICNREYYLQLLASHLLHSETDDVLNEDALYTQEALHFTGHWSNKRAKIIVSEYMHLIFEWDTYGMLKCTLKMLDDTLRIYGGLVGKPINYQANFKIWLFKNEF